MGPFVTLNLQFTQFNTATFRQNMCKDKKYRNAHRSTASNTCVNASAHTCSRHINTIKNHFTTRSLTEHYFAATLINHPRAVSHSSNISIMVHHLRLGEMKVIHSKMNHSCPACHMPFRVRRRLYCRFLGHLSSACIFEVLQRRLVYLK